jgi:hypothetical protein
MTTLSNAAHRPLELGNINQLPVIANDIIYQFAAVGDNGSGYARPLQAGDPFRGFAEATVDNSGGSAGDKDVRLIESGKILLNISGLTITDVGKPVYASDDDTFVLTASTNSFIGRVVRFVKAGVGIVAFDANRAGLGGTAELTDNTGGTPSDTLAAISDTLTGVDGTDSNAAPLAGVNTQLGIIKDAIASLAAKQNEILRMLGG